MRVLGSGAATEHAVLAVLDAAYTHANTTQQWLANVVGAARPVLDQGCGVMGAIFELDHRCQLKVQPPAMVGDLPREYLDIFLATSPSLSPSDVLDSFAHPRSFDTASAAWSRTHPHLHYADAELFAPLRPFDIADQLAVKLVDATGTGCLLVAPLTQVCATDPVATEVWRRVMTHVLAGLRLRDRVGSTAPEAVLEASGAVVHAEGPARSRTARDSLREAVLHASAVRNRTSDTVASLRAWRALTSGRWSLLDRFDSDGRRYLVAYRNAPPVAAPRTLTERERQVLAYTALGYTNKQIAYALGLAASTISSHLVAAQRVLGGYNREQLVQACLADPDPNEPSAA